jgi:curli biogenesis system outer membrane secretion channel CsgG
MTWLQKRGLAIVERARLQEVLNEQMIRLTHTSDDDAALLRVGRLLGADLIVFVEAGSTKSVASSSEMYVGAYGGYGESSSVPVHSSVVNVRAVDIQTGEVVWSGTARYPTMDTGAPEDSFVKLTCQALATAWGFRPAGQREIPSQSMCAIEAPIPVN